MAGVPRILPVVAVAMGGVLAINALAGASDLPGLVGGAKAFAEDLAAKAKPTKDAGKAKANDAKAPAEPMKLAAAGPLPSNRAAGAPAQPAAVCTPTDAAIAKEAGLSPEQMRLLESLQARRGQLDDREKAMELQLQLLAAAEKKLDARIATLNALKGEVQNLLGQADEKQKAEVSRMVGVYTTMAQQKPKEAAKQLTIMDDAVRLPIVAGLSNRTLATILANMQPADAKTLNEAMARRFETKKADATRQALSAAAAAAQPDAPAAEKPAPVKTAQAAPKARPKPRARATPKAADPLDAAAPSTPPADKPATG